MKKIVYISDLTKKLKLLRHKYDLTQDDVANALEIHRSTYAYYEIGRTIPSIGILKALSRIYRVPIDFFLDTNYEEHETDTDLIEGIKQALQYNKLVEDEMEFFVRVRFPTLNTKLKKLRTDHYLTQQEVADYLKIDRSTYAKYELGRSEPSLFALKALSTLYGVSLDSFLDLDKKMIANMKARAEDVMRRSHENTALSEVKR